MRLAGIERDRHTFGKVAHNEEAWHGGRSRFGNGAEGIKVFLLLFRKTKEDSSFFEKKEAKKLLFSGGRARQHRV
jgi:hypothetical protein